MKRMPEKPLLAEEQDKKETVAFVATLAVASFFSLTVVGIAYRGDTVINRVLQTGCVFGSAFLANIVKKRMAKEHDEKVRVWLNYWDEYREDMESYEKEMNSEKNQIVKDTMMLKLKNKKEFYENNYY